MSINKLFLKYVLQDNNWIGNSVMKLVNFVEFQKRKVRIEGDNDNSENFEMKILAECALYEALIFPQQTSLGGKIGIPFMRLLTMDNLINHMLSFQNNF